MNLFQHNFYDINKSVWIYQFIVEKIMPTYDYLCTECQFKFDKILRIDDRETPTKDPCPNCNNTSVTLTLSAPSLVSPFRIDGLKKPSGAFKDRMAQIKTGLGKTKHNLRDH
jgi:putative FmdB family regulatory protein